MWTKEDFLAQIRAQPDDDGLRNVFADWLLERGDPRGELIRLQLERHAGRTSPQARRREAALLKKHAREWLDGLDAVVRKEHAVFERGLLASGACNSDHFASGSGTNVLEHPAWVTLRELVFLGGFVHAPAARLPRFLKHASALRAVHNLSVSGMMALAKEAAPQLTALSVCGMWRNPDRSRRPSPAPFDGPGLGALRSLGVGRIFDLEPEAWLPAMPFVTRLEELTLYGETMLGPALGWAPRVAPSLARIAVVSHGTPWVGRPRDWRIEMSRDTEGRFSVLDASYCKRGHPIEYGMSTLLGALGSLPTDALTSVTVRHAYGAPSTSPRKNELDLREGQPSTRTPIRDALDHALARHSRASRLQIRIP